MRKNFWIVKGNPSYPIPGVDNRSGDIEGFLRAFNWSDWITYRRIRDDFKPNDRVFFWSSGRIRAIVGLAIVRKVHKDKQHFDLNHISEDILPKANQLGIEEIKSAFRRHFSPSRYDKVTYIKPCVVATIYPVADEEAHILIRLLLDKNPQNNHLAEWFQATPSISQPSYSP